jgi:TRAP-type mannitol/chloroaromatic compound transport system permease large subunit
MVLFLAVASNIYGAVFTRLGTSTLIAESMLALPVSPAMLLVVLMAVIFLLGWPLEWPAIIFIFLPIFMPVVEALKIDMVWFCTLVAVNLQTAFLSPPVAMAAYYLKAVAPKWELSQIYRGMFDFMLLQLVGLAIVFFFPQTALWLPEKLFGK